MAETRIPLQRALTASIGLTRRRIPASLDELDRTLIASRRLAGQLQRDVGRTTAQVTTTAATLGTTAEAFGGTAQDLRRTSALAHRILEHSAGSGEQLLPVLLHTLQELNAIATTSNSLVRRLHDSWLLELLSPPADGPVPAAPPATPAQAAAPSGR